MRREISSILRFFNKRYSLKGERRVSLKSFDSFFSRISKSHRKSGAEIEKHYPDELYILQLHLTEFGSLTLAANQHSEKKNKILSEEFTGKDIHLCALLNNISNTATAAISLVKQGFDTQARVLLRTLDERIYQCLVLLSSSEDIEQWAKSEEQDDAKDSHYWLFARKGRLLKELAKLEKLYLGVHNQQEMSKWKKEREVYYSMSVHGSSAAVMAGSTAFSFEKIGYCTLPNLFGIPSEASGATLYHMIYQFQYFSSLLSAILDEEHRWDPNMECEHQRMYVFARNAAIICGKEFLWGEEG